MIASKKDPDPKIVTSDDGDVQKEPGVDNPAPETDQTSGQLEEAQKEIETLKDQLLRKAAEFENYKRRIDGEYKSIVENATEYLIRDLLPVLDDFERLLKSSKEQTNHDALREGFELISNKLKAVLSLRGLAPFESEGKPFNVEYHDALLQIPRDDVPPNTVIEEVSRGYHLNDKILRHAKVVVSSPATPDEPTETNTGSNDPDDIPG